MVSKWDRLIGPESSFPVEHRILNIILLLGIFLASFGAVFFAIFNLGWLPRAVSGISVIVLAVLYYRSMQRKNYSGTALLLILIFGFGVVPLTWFTMGGIIGGTPFYALIYAAMITTLLRGRQRGVVLLCFVAMLSVLMLLQYTNPALIRSPYEQETQRFADIFFAMLTAMIAVITFFVVILNHYISEYQRSQNYLSQLEKQRMAIELSRLDRLNLIGEMAASIGHEVRNPLTTVRGFLQLFQRQPDFTAYEKRFELMIDELDRANQIITEFLSLAKNKSINLKPDNLNRIIGNIQILIQADALLMGKQFITELNDIPDLPLDENEIRQCIFNFVRNGFEAIEGEGSVVLKTFTANDEVILSIEDDGPGISPEIFAKLGTPFVTTKPQGTGLGLPVCYRIAERHGAKIEIETSPAGTTFLLKFVHRPDVDQLPL
ncbi:MAG: ATP-binding protein [Negativicutes bacterium]|nr:ATP-binding protein [Negativicutes bacterium]